MISKKQYNEIIDNIPVSQHYERNHDCRLIITGTFLLYSHGLVDSFNDIDILVVDAGISFWATALGENEWEVRDYGDYRSIKITSCGYTYNLIEDDSYNEHTNGFADCNGEFEFDTLSHALKAKARLDRPKDKPHFEKIKERINQLITL